MVACLAASAWNHGVILSEPYPTRWIEALRKFTPVIYTVGHDFQRGVNSVYFNEPRAAALVVDRLRAAGHQRIGWLGVFDTYAPFNVPDEEFGPDDSSADWLARSTHGTRFASWLYMAREHRGSVGWPVSLVERDWRTCSLSDAVRRGRLELFAARPRPTVIVCVGYSIARELILQLEAEGLRVPADVSVVSYSVEMHGDADDGTNDSRHLTGLLMPMDKVGGLVPEVVQRCLAYPDGLPISIQFDAEWEPGETLAAPSS
jgi:DNA-binding LacI/PurR family transcriptional regulator